MLGDEIPRHIAEKLLHKPPQNLDEELASLLRASPGSIHCLSLTAHYRGPEASGVHWIDGAFEERFRTGIGLPTHGMRSKVPFASPAELRAIWDWMRASQTARAIPHLYAREHWLPSESALQGKALFAHNLDAALSGLAAPLLGLSVEEWRDDRGPGGGVRVHASIASTLTGAADPVAATLFDGGDSPEEAARIRSWVQRAADAHGVPAQL